MSNEIRPLTQPELVTLNKLIEESVDSRMRIDSEKEHQKDIATRAKEELDLPTKRFNQLVGQRHENKLSDELTEREETMTLYEQVENAVNNNGS